MSSGKNIFAHLKSFYSLILIGFIFVAIPLAAAVFTGVYYVDKLTDQSQQAVFRAVKSTQLSRILVQQATAMERNVRQYFILGNASLLDSYFDRHHNYIKVAEELANTTLDLNLRENLQTLTVLEKTLHDRLVLKVKAQENIDINTHDFITMTEVAKTILKSSNAVIDIEMDIMNKLSDKASETMFWETMMLIPTSLIFIFVFTSLLAKPMRQMDKAIRTLGDGEFEHELRVNGPRDMEILGERLDWLRLRLKYLEDKKVKFLQYVSHELKTPLTAIREGAELMSEGVTGNLNDHQREVADILKNNSISLQKMIEKLLSFNMPNEANLSSGYSKIRTKKVIDNVIADHKAVILAKKIRIKARCEDLTFNADEEQFRVVVDNLLSNGLKFTPENGLINISLKRREGNVILDFKDSGPGIAVDDREKIFNAFYSGKPPDKGYIQGSGLGLSIVKEFVEAQNGSIEVVNENVGYGAHFRIIWPLGDEEKELAWAV